MPDELPEEIVEKAVELSQKAQHPQLPTDRFERERDALVSEYGFRARIRDDDSRGPVLVCYPDDWLSEGTVRLSRVDNTDRAVERPLFTVETDQTWERVYSHNEEVVTQVFNEFGEVHGENAQAFADYMSNHYKRQVESAGSHELNEFLNEYYPRNAWPSEAQKRVVEESLRLVFTVTGTQPPSVIE